MQFIMKALELFKTDGFKFEPVEDVTMKTELNIGNARHAFEFLELIDKAPSEEEQIALLKKWGDKPPLSMLLSLNFNSKVQLDLPPGIPTTLNRDETIHPDLATPLAAQIGRLKACVKANPIRKMDKERVFIQVMEQISFKEADVLVACKDKTLNELFPNIKAETVAKVFPNYVA